MTIPPPDIPPPDTAPAISPPLVAPTQPVGQDQELRSLVTQILQSSDLGFDPNTTRKGIVQSITTGATPTLTIQMSGDTTTNVVGVRYIDSYSPVVGDTVLIMKQGPDLFAIGRIAISTATEVGWVQATLSSGFTHGSEAVQYRKVWDNGSWKMQWRGQANRSSNQTVISGLATDLRPTVSKTLPYGRVSQWAASILFNSDGTVTLQNESTLSSTDTSTAGGVHDHGGTTGQNGNEHLHSHGGTVPSTSFVSTHGHSIPSSGGGHTHDTTATMNFLFPTVVHFSGIEYFL